MVLDSGLPDAVGDDERLARLVHERSKFNSAGAKPAAFVPPANGALSVARHSAEPVEELERLALEYLGGKRAYGAATLLASEVRTIGLDVLAEEPPPRHANILGWPTSTDEDEQKAQRKLRALELASKAGWVAFAGGAS
ncbi:MAG TPA: hypothetical protein PLL78_07380 [Fimbriimonadaceae bacterium]|mgnify:CR=1 FL=1|nr:hypothetical protein [Fimbriimonadaceae bacterium]HRJ96494.1 hypothetical protein [Fimbriimonadaceae bacterium]